MLQRTLKESVHFIGRGVHSATTVGLSIHPARTDYGIRFERTDERGTVVKALAQNVCDTTLSTSIAFDDIQIATVEHLMSALWGTRVDNALIEITGEEVPIMDGSAAPFVEQIQRVGTVEQEAKRRYIRIKRPIEVTQGTATASLRPYNGFSASYTFVADHPVYNRFPKHVSLDMNESVYMHEVCQARSFGLMAELPAAQSINRCLGSTLDNAVGVGEDEILNPEGLRSHDEFVKHKILDAIGDLYLLGAPIIGQFFGYMSGHALNNKLTHALLRVPEAWEYVNRTVVADADSNVVALGGRVPNP